jgi:hypothetical protein
MGIDSAEHCEYFLVASAQVSSSFGYMLYVFVHGSKLVAHALPFWEPFGFIYYGQGLDTH